MTTDSDTDGDFLSDVLEVTVVTDPFDATSPFSDPAVDNDRDGVPDSIEFVIGYLGVPGEVDAGTDTDMDGAPDYLEVIGSGDLLDGNDPVVDGAEDPDDDGLSSALEAVLGFIVGGEFGSTSDSDGDGLPDYFEVNTSSNPLLVDHPVLGGGADTNEASGPADTVTDGLEQVLIQMGATAPVTQGTDSDDDGTPDYLEVLAATDAFDSQSPVPNGNTDPDRDRIRSSAEIVLARLGAEVPVGLTNDTDGDGVPDYAEILILYNPIDTDDPLPDGGADVNAATGPNGDTISDALEFLLIRQGASPPVGTPTDTDSDGIPDYFEITIGSNPFEANLPFPTGAEDSNDSTGPAGDGISDGLESIILFLAAQAGSPTTRITTDTDTDGDGVPDYLEVYLGTSLIDGDDFPASGFAPQAAGLAITGTPEEGGTLSGTYVYFDNDDDFEGGTSFRWLRDGAPIEGATQPSYVLSALDVGTVVSFEVTPVSLYAWPPETLVGTPVEVSILIPAPGIALSVGGPGGIGNTSLADELALWLSADRGVTTEATDRADVERVTGWSDRSSRRLRAIPLQDAPRFVAPSGTQPAAIRFDEREGLVLARSVSGEFTLVTTFRTGEPESSLFGGAPGAGELVDLALGLVGGRPRLEATGRSLSAPGRFDDGRLHTLQAVISDEQLTLQLDGEELARLELPRLADLSPTRFAIGATPEPTGLPGFPGEFVGEIGELVLFDRALDPLEQSLVDHYLAGRYGIDLAEPRYDAFESHPAHIAGLARSETFTQSVARGTGEVVLSHPSSLDAGDALLFGANEPERLYSREAPPGIGARRARSWAYTLTDGSGDGVGTVDVTFLLGEDSAVRTASDMVLLIDDDRCEFLRLSL